jgi:hypothetical protein
MMNFAKTPVTKPAMMVQIIPILGNSLLVGASRNVAARPTVFETSITEHRRPNSVQLDLGPWNTACTEAHFGAREPDPKRGQALETLAAKVQILD